MTAKRKAYEFLESVQDRLNRELLGPTEMQKQVEKIRALAAGQPSQKHLGGREHTFTNAIVVPILFEMLSTYPGMTCEMAKAAFLSESYRSLSKFCSGSPARRLRHPFNKGFGADPNQVYLQWHGKLKGQPLTQSCPDFAFRSPFPHRIVFEAKYFMSSSATTAQRELVTSAYQAFFYRALPPDRTNTTRPDWDYDYSCLLAYDASKDGALRDAWRQIDPKVKCGFWEGANVYVMVLRGREV